MEQGKLVLIIGPSGVGKSVILKELRSRHPEYHFPRSATTRPRRPGEGNELYHFVTEEQFDRLLREEKFLEWATVHAAYRYGTLLDEIIPFIEQGKNVIREVDVQGFDAIRKNALFTGDHPQYRLQSIFILPENAEQLVARITRRAPMSENELKLRLKSMEKELAYADHCTTKVMNRDGHLAETIQEVEQTIAQ